MAGWKRTSNERQWRRRWQFDAVKRMKESERRVGGRKKPRPTAYCDTGHRPEYLMQQVATRGDFTGSWT